MELGGFDEEFFMYYEETELSYRIRKKGYKIFVLCSVKIVHLEGGSQENNISDLKKQWMADSKKKYYIKTHRKGFLISNVIQHLICLRDSFVKKTRKF